MRQGIMLVFFLSLLGFGWMSACSKASPDSFIEYRRTGGFIGFDDNLLIDINGNVTLIQKGQRQEWLLDSDTMSQLQNIFEEASFTSLDFQYLPSQQGGDLINYVIIYKGHKVETMDGAIPNSLAPIIDTLNALIEGRYTP
jgi:hypothetical protein